MSWIIIIIMYLVSKYVFSFWSIPLGLLWVQNGCGICKDWINFKVFIFSLIWKELRHFLLGSCVTTCIDIKRESLMPLWSKGYKQSHWVTMPKYLLAMKIQKDPVHKRISHPLNCLFLCVFRANCRLTSNSISIYTHRSYLTNV